MSTRSCLLTAVWSLLFLQQSTGTFTANSQTDTVYVANAGHIKFICYTRPVGNLRLIELTRGKTNEVLKTVDPYYKLSYIEFGLKCTKDKVIVYNCTGKNYFSESLNIGTIHVHCLASSNSEGGSPLVNIITIIAGLCVLTFIVTCFMKRYHKHQRRRSERRPDRPREIHVSVNFSDLMANAEGAVENGTSTQWTNNTTTGSGTNGSVYALPDHEEERLAPAFAQPPPPYGTVMGTTARSSRSDEAEGSTGLPAYFKQYSLDPPSYDSVAYPSGSLTTPWFDAGR